MKSKRRKLLAERRAIIKEMARLHEISNSWGSSIDYARHAANERYKLSKELQRVEDKLYPEKAKKRKDEERTRNTKARAALHDTPMLMARLATKDYIMSLTFSHAIS